MHTSYVLGQGKIRLHVAFIKENEYEVESGEEGGWKIDIFLGGFFWVISTIKGIGCR